MNTENLLADQVADLSLDLAIERQRAQIEGDLRALLYSKLLSRLSAEEEVYTGIAMDVALTLRSRAAAIEKILKALGSEDCKGDTSGTLIVMAARQAAEAGFDEGVEFVVHMLKTEKFIVFPKRPDGQPVQPGMQIPTL